MKEAASGSRSALKVCGEGGKLPRSHTFCAARGFLNPIHYVKYSCVPARTGRGAEVGASHALF